MEEVQARVESISYIDKRKEQIIPASEVIRWMGGLSYIGA